MEFDTLVMSTSLDYNANSGYCPYCSNPPYQFVYHGSHCPLVKAKEYHRHGGLKRVEFHEPVPATINVEVPPISLEDSMSYKKAREVEIKEPTLLEPGRYTIVLGELCKIDPGYPPWFDGKSGLLDNNSGLLKARKDA